MFGAGLALGFPDGLQLREFAEEVFGGGRRDRRRTRVWTRARRVLIGLGGRLVPLEFLIDEVDEQEHDQHRD